MRSSRVNWGSIMAGAVTATGVLMCFAFLARALGINGPSSIAAGVISFPPSVTEPGLGGAIYALISTALSFAVGGYAVAALGSFKVERAGVLHALAAFSTAALAIHYLGRDILYFARPGIPFFAPFPQSGLSDQQIWVLFLSIVTSAVSCCGGAAWCWRRSTRVILTERRESARDRAA